MIVLLAVVNVLNAMDRTVLSVVMPLIKVDLRLSDAQLGLLVGFAFFLFYATCGIPIARWADRGIRRNMIAAAIGIWSVMTALSGASQTFWHLLAARIGLGASEAGCNPACQSIMADYVPLTRRAGAYSVYGLGAVLGTTLGLVLAGALAELVGWRWTFVALGLPGIAIAVTVRLTLREPRRGVFDVAKDDTANVSLGEATKILWRCRTYRRLAMYCILAGFIQAGLMQWYPSFYMRAFGISSSQVGLYLGLSMGIGSALGLVIGGLLANKAAQRNIELPFTIGAGAVLLSLPASVGLVFVPSLLSSMLLVTLNGLLWNLPGGYAGAIMCSVTKPSMRATACAIMIFFMSLLGFGFGPFCVGVLSDLLTPALGSEALRYALLCPVCLLPLMAVVLYAMRKDLRRDLQAAGAQMPERIASL